MSLKVHFHYNLKVHASDDFQEEKHVVEELEFRLRAFSLLFLLNDDISQLFVDIFQLILDWMLTRACTVWRWAHKHENQALLHEEKRQLKNVPLRRGINKIAKKGADTTLDEENNLNFQLENPTKKSMSFIESIQGTKVVKNTHTSFCYNYTL